MKPTNPIGHFFVLFAGAVFTLLAGCSGTSDSKRNAGDGGSADPAPAAIRFDPTVARIPAPSKSLTLGTDWQPPAPTRTPNVELKPRVKPKRHWGAPVQTISEHPSDTEIRRLRFFPEPLRPVPGTSEPAESDALAAALRQSGKNEQRDIALEHFVEMYPASRWTPGLHLNLGTRAFRQGYFQSALTHWMATWESAKAGTDDVSISTANLGLAEAARMNARIGRLREVESLLVQVRGRALSPSAYKKLRDASEGAFMMRHEPGLSFRCGPYALMNVAKAQQVDLSTKSRIAFLEKTQSPATGFSIPEVQRMAVDLGMKLRIAKREPGAPVIVPSVVHWKVGHFGALIREVKGGFLLKDPTFGEDMAIKASALDREASGYFIVPAGPLPPGWSPASEKETAQLYGKGYAKVLDNATREGDHMVAGLCQGNRGFSEPGMDMNKAMAAYRFHTMDASLYVEDTPISHSAAYGPDVRIKLKYTEAGDDVEFTGTSFGSFHTSWSDSYYRAEYQYVTGDVNSPVTVVVPAHEPNMPDDGEQQEGAGFLHQGNSRDYYEHVLEQDEDVASPPIHLLSRVVDPQGNEVDVEYDETLPTRIAQLVDATGLATVFHYDYPDWEYLVTSIDDPYGRVATFTYAMVAGTPALQSTQDPYGITSSFAYDSTTGKLASMTTPYGTSTFKSTESFIQQDATPPDGYARLRYLEATDPLGQTEHIEFNINASTGVGDGLESPQPNSSVISFSPSFNNYRNTFYWDKVAWRAAPMDYSKARLYHWLHKDENVVSGRLESERAPFETRIFYNYGAQPNTWTVGSLGLPIAVGRVVPDATGTNQTRAFKATYDTGGNILSVTDPLGRKTAFSYNSGLDITQVQQSVGTSSWETISSATYGSGAPTHRPVTVTDGSGQTSSFTYSATTGQVLTVTNAKSEVTTFTYGMNSATADYGRLVSVSGAVPGGDRSFTYDGYGRLRTSTDSDGYSLTFDYDALDRLRTVTYPDGSTEQLEYADHSLVASKDRQGRWTRHMYNQLMQRVVTQDPLLRTTQFEWCGCGELRRFIDANNNITEWQRDEASRVIKKVNPDATFETFTYDIAGRLSTAVNTAGQTVTYKYAIDDQLIKQDYSDTATPDVTFAYDSHYARPTSRQDGAGTTAFTYQPYNGATYGAGQLALVDGPLADDTQKFTYDELSRLKRLQIVDDTTHTTATWSEEYTFDSRGRVTTVANSLGSSTIGFVGQSSRPSSVTLPNGMQTQYDYFTNTGDFLLKQIKNLSSGATPSVISQFDYTYGPDRSIATWKEDQGSGAKTWAYGYDDAGQLIKADQRDASNTLLQSLSYGYDKAGNRTQAADGATAPKNYDTNNLNQLLSERDFGPTTFAGFTDEAATVKVNGTPAKVTSTDGGAPFHFESLVEFDAGTNTVVVEAKDGQNNTRTKTYAVTTTGTSTKYEYDVKGNLRFEKQPNGTIIREYQWDEQNRLIKSIFGTHESDYDYDAASRRWRITEKEGGTQTKQETFVWCSSTICQKRSGLTVERNYLSGGFQEGTSTYITTADHLGSAREVIGSDGATVASRLSYDPWGSGTTVGSGATPDFTYTGHYYDKATGLNLAQYRVYDGRRGRWLSPDPSGLNGGLNLYGYANESPVNFVDPSGLEPWWVILDESGALDDASGGGLGLLDNIPLFPGMPGSPTLGDAVQATGVAGCSSKRGRIAGRIMGGVVLASAGGGPSEVVYHKHHVFPQEFATQFQEMGIDIHKWTLEMPANVHREVHSAGWNADWEAFLFQNEELPSPQAAGNLAASLMHDYDLYRYLPFKDY